MALCYAVPAAIAHHDLQVDPDAGLLHHMRWYFYVGALWIAIYWAFFATGHTPKKPAAAAAAAAGAGAAAPAVATNQ